MWPFDHPYAIAAQLVRPSASASAPNTTGNPGRATQQLAQ